MRIFTYQIQVFQLVLKPQDRLSSMLMERYLPMKQCVLLQLEMLVLVIPRHLINCQLVVRLRLVILHLMEVLQQKVTFQHLLGLVGLLLELILVVLYR